MRTIFSDKLKYDEKNNQKNELVEYTLKHGRLRETT